MSEPSKAEIKNNRLEIKTEIEGEKVGISAPKDTDPSLILSILDCIRLAETAPKEARETPISSSWDYGQAEQVAVEYEDAMKRGLCPRCAVHKLAANSDICSPCIRDEERDRDDHDR